MSSSATVHADQSLNVSAGEPEFLRGVHPELRDTYHFLRADVHLHSWFLSTVEEARESLRRMTDEMKKLEPVDDPDGYGIGRDKKWNQTAPEEQRVPQRNDEYRLRRLESLGQVRALAGRVEPCILAMATAAGVKQYPSVQRRIVNSAPLSYDFMTKEDREKIPEASMIERARKTDQKPDGRLHVLEQEMLFTTNAFFPPRSFEKRFIHELTHAKIQNVHNELRPTTEVRVPPAPRFAYLAEFDYPIWQSYKKRFLSGELLKEGCAELLAVQAAAFLGESIDDRHFTYRDHVGIVCFLRGLDQKYGTGGSDGVTDWFVGASSTQDFYERQRAYLTERLGMDRRNALILLNLAFDTRDEKSALQGTYTNPNITFYTWVRRQREAGLDIHDLMLKGGLPSSVEHIYFPKQAVPAGTMR
jgi:hypothetical protein